MPFFSTSFFFFCDLRYKRKGINNYSKYRVLFTENNCGYDAKYPGRYVKTEFFFSFRGLGVGLFLFLLLVDFYFMQLCMFVLYVCETCISFLSPVYIQ